MSHGLPLEIIGLISPILCWVEGGERPGLPDAWHGHSYSFDERVKSWLKRELPTYSYDNLNEIISLASDRWTPHHIPTESHLFSNTKREIPMAPPRDFRLLYVFNKLSRHYFKWVGNTLCVREERMVELHELAMRFPVRHLVRYCHADAVARGYISMGRALELPVQMNRLHTTYQSIRTVVERGLYEGHLHLNGVINADEAWADQLLLRVSPGVQDGFTPDADRLLVLSRTAVRLLAVGLLYAFLEVGCGEYPPFHLIRRLDRMYRARNPLEDREARRGLNKEFNEAFKALERQTRTTGPLEKEYYWLLELANPGVHFRWHRDDNRGRFQQFGQSRGIRYRINLLKRLHLTAQRFLVEQNLYDNPHQLKPVPGLPPQDTVYNPLDKKNRPICEFIHQVFIRYIIYHAHHWQKGTQHGKTTGLRNFQLFFNAKQRNLMEKGCDDWEGLSLEQLGESGPLRYLEGRLSPPTTGVCDFIRWVLAFVNQADKNKLDRFGIVVHFRKDHFKGVENRIFFRDRLDLRYGKIRRLTRVNAFKLFRLLSTPSLLVPFIVGIDAANLELTTPPEVFAPAFRFLREYPIELRQISTTRRIFGEYEKVADLVKNRRLGMTYHVGEEFRHLLSGLRAIHEVIEFLKPVPGDRLGHAIALALDPEVWAAQVGNQAVISRQEWLDTLVWVHSFLGAGHDLIGQLSLEDEIQLYSRKIYVGGSREEKDWQIPTLYDSWLLRQVDPYSLEKPHPDDKEFRICPQGQSIEHKRWADIQSQVLKEVDKFIGTSSAFRLVRQYWYNPKVRHIGSQIVTIDMTANKKLWLKVCREVQEKLQDIVRARQLVVEVNPSSNRVVGPMAEINDHPIFRLTLDKEHNLSRENRVTINTDDPGVFTTSLAHEFYLLGEILVNRGVPEAKVEEWLDWLRKNGEDYSFLNRLPDVKDTRMRIILDSLSKRYEPMIRRLKGQRKQYRPPESSIKSNKELEQENKRLKTIYKQMEARLEALEKKLQ